LPDLIVHSIADYETLALTLARDRPRLGGLKERLAANRATRPLYDTDRFRRHIEAAYATMWARHQRGDAPASFSVDPAR
jgi:protein O-GlcNAc transferase